MIGEAFLMLSWTPKIWLIFFRKVIGIMSRSDLFFVCQSSEGSKQTLKECERCEKKIKTFFIAFWRVFRPPLSGKQVEPLRRRFLDFFSKKKRVHVNLWHLSNTGYGKLRQYAACRPKLAVLRELRYRLQKLEVS